MLLLLVLLLLGALQTQSLPRQIKTNPTYLMESIDPKCTDLKLKYETCFNNWYSEKFLKGDTQDICASLFQDYRACIDVQRIILSAY